MGEHDEPELLHSTRPHIADDVLLHVEKDRKLGHMKRTKDILTCTYPNSMLLCSRIHSCETPHVRCIRRLAGNRSIDPWFLYPSYTLNRLIARLLVWLSLVEQSRPSLITCPNDVLGMCCSMPIVCRQRNNQQWHRSVYWTRI